jgi:hypothetical protein
VEAFGQHAHYGVLMSVAGRNVLGRRSALAISPASFPEADLVSYPKLGGVKKAIQRMISASG